MNTRQFFAPTHREAMRRLRAELGNEAMILSSRNIDGGVEVIALLDYEETASTPPAVTTGDTPSDVMAQPDSSMVAVEGDAQKMMASLLSEMQSMKAVLTDKGMAGKRQTMVSPEDAFVRSGLGHGLSEALCRTLWTQTVDKAHLSCDERMKAGLTDVLSVNPHDEWLTRGGIFALVGPTGVGKTTTVAKLTARFSLRGSKDSIALITTDTHRVGGREQLLTYGRLFGVEAHAARSQEELAALVESLSHKRLILIDTVGVGQRDQRVSEQLAMLPLQNPRLRPILVLDSTRHGDTLDDVARVYHEALSALPGGRVADCILSKTDEALHISSAVDVAARRHLNILCLTNGQNITEHLSWYRSDALVQYVFAPREETAFSLPEASLAYGGGTPVSVPAQWAGQLLREGKRLNACVHYLRDQVGGFRTLETLWRNERDAQALTEPAVQLQELTQSPAASGRLDVFWQRKSNNVTRPAFIFAEANELPCVTFLPRKGLPVSMAGRSIWLGDQLPEARIRHHFSQLPDATTRQALEQFGVGWRALVRGNMKIEHRGERMTMQQLSDEMTFERAGQFKYKDQETELELGWLDASVDGAGPAQRVHLIIARIVDPVTRELLTSRYGLDQGVLSSAEYSQDLALWIQRVLAVEAQAPLMRKAENELGQETFASDSLIRSFAAAQASLVAWRLKNDGSDEGRIMRDQVLKITRSGRQASAQGMLKATLKLCAMVDALGQCALAEAC
ncbi:flagellar biosynthesis protein FlhF [Larsenimonas rhizosphaerae]|uniref:flagellar biosynthesis protein FlhF n=1 Tax=Larsenimonas rhizosphaerae TaxID=2944682 RepID=UPI0020333F10|nr:flagellar biosynthesis protein FlhF [Larsenimonas rhizosphaerae]MCM2130390.1 flagellar biosynthesis protein FlhF [Larsenimonas rhizosphaerae]